MNSVLTSLRSPHIGRVKALHTSKGRKTANEFLAEGPQAVEAAAKSKRFKVTQIYVTEAALLQFSKLITSDPIVVSEKVMAAMSSVENSQGILATCMKDALPDLNKLTATANLLIYCHEINDPGNLGTIIRSAHALGAQGLVLSPGSVDPFSPKVVRASAGSLWQLPFVININFEELVRSAQEVGMKSIAMTGGGKKTLNDYINLLPKKSVFVFGNEAHGLPKEIITKCDEQVRIPMKAGAESLNLATSAALVIYAASNAQTPIE